MTDPIADMLTRVRNAVQAKHQKVDMPASRLKTEIARILKEEGYIAHYKTAEEEGKNFLTIFLKYGPKGEKVITVVADDGTEFEYAVSRRAHLGVRDGQEVQAGDRLIGDEKSPLR